MKGISLNNDTLNIAVKRDSEGLITSGLVISDVTRQNQALLIASQKGEFKENPLLGVGIADYINSEDLSGLKVAIKKQLKADGQTVTYVGFSGDDLLIEAEYE